jgi:hypothetical protein
MWSIDPMTIQRLNTTAFIYTVPLMLLILFKYSLDIEADTDGDPTSILLHDKILVVLCLVYVATVAAIIFLSR